MGYRTDYLLEASPVTEDLFEQIDAVLLERNRYFGLNERCFYGDKGRWQDDDDTWLEYEEDMLAVSRLFPQVQFILSGCGERNEDQWRQIFVDGRTQRCEGFTVFPPFKEKKIVDPNITLEPEEQTEELQLSDDHIDRLDDIDNAVYQCILVLLNKTEEEFPWDMHYIGEVTDGIVDFLIEKGHRIYRPAIVTEHDGTQHIEEYEVKENEGNET